MRLLIIFSILIYSFSCVPNKHNNKDVYIVQDTIMSVKDKIYDNLTYQNLTDFIKKINQVNTKGKQINNGFIKINPFKIELGKIDSISEGFVWEKDTILIKQPYMINASFRLDSLRKVLINGRLVKKTYRVNFKERTKEENNLPFDKVLFDYYYVFEDGLFQYKSNYILITQPMAWSGKSNKFKFIQIISTKSNIVYEFYINSETN